MTDDDTDIDGRRFSKTAAIKAVDSETQTATGAVLVPDEVDRQRDFIREKGVRNLFTDTPDDGVMHTAFPDDAAELVETYVADQPVEIDGEQFPAGTWIARRKYHDDDLWTLVEDEILTGFSIGGEITQAADYAEEEVPDDIAFSGPVEPGPATEILDGRVEEISDVDIPAVPRAVYQTVKSLGKSVVDDVADKDEFVAVMQDRGHSAADAKELWAFLQNHTDTDTEQSKAGGPSAGDVDDATLGKRLKRLLFGAPSSSSTATGSPTLTDDGGTSPEDSDADSDATEKEGRTLSRHNRRALMASVDAQLDILDDAGVDHGITQFSNRDDFAFDLGSYGKAADEQSQKNDAPGGDTPDGTMTDNDDTTTDSNDTDKGLDDAPEWADALAEKVESVEQRVNDMEADDDGDGEKGLDDAPEWAADLAEKVDDLDDRVERVSKATADTQQVGGAEDAGETDDLTEMERAKRALFLPDN